MDSPDRKPKILGDFALRMAVAEHDQGLLNLGRLIVKQATELVIGESDLTRRRLPSRPFVQAVWAAAGLGTIALDRRTAFPRSIEHFVMGDLRQESYQFVGRLEGKILGWCVEERCPGVLGEVHGIELGAQSTVESIVHDALNRFTVALEDFPSCIGIARAQTFHQLLEFVPWAGHREVSAPFLRIKNTLARAQGQRRCRQRWEDA